MELFNMTIDGLGDALLGEDAEKDNFKEFGDGLEYDEEKRFVDVVSEAFLIEEE